MSLKGVGSVSIFLCKINKILRPKAKHKISPRAIEPKTGINKMGKSKKYALRLIGFFIFDCSGFY